MSRRKPCGFHQRPGGCRKGENCEYLHTGSSDGSSQSTRVTSASPPATPERMRAPNGICNQFWASGQCTRNFDCRFKHERQTPAISRRRGVPSATGLMVATSTNGERAFNATEVHNHLGRFLRDDYRFASPNDLYAFISLLGHATKENNWNIEDGQLLLTTLATPGNNGLLRLGDIVRHQDVVINAGTSPRLVSFQRAYLPLLVYFASEFVVKSTLNHNVNALYTLIHNDFEAFSNTIKSSMDDFMTSKTFRDPHTGKSILGISVFSSISTVLFEYLTRFRHATAHQPAVTPLVHNLRDWLDVWISGINSIPPTFEDTWTSQQGSASRVLSTNRVRDQVGRIVAIVDREQAARDKYTRPKKTTLISDISGDIGVVAYLEAGFIGPGDEREGGPRHDNDFANISDVRIAPTHQELTCHHPPFLPANIPNAPHHLQCDSMERLLDIQFRLLREELIAPLRTGIQLVMQDLCVAPGKKTILSNLLAKHGGRYIGSLKSHDSLMFNVYTGCQFTEFELHPYRGITVEMSLDAPPGSARSTNGAVRSKFWDGKGGKRLLQGGLFALIWGARDPSIYLGVVASSTKDLALSAKKSNDGRVKLQVSFFDTEAEVRILQAIKNRNNKEQALKLLIEAPVMYETIRPFLTALCAEPTSFPFNRYLTHPKSGSLETIDINPPAYAANTAFTFDLRCLFRETPAEDVRLNVMDSSVAEACRQELRVPNSRLDPSQADALVDALTREIALIQGPPGTGKTYIGVELIRVLLTNGVGPLLMIAFTNHALDHMLSSVLDAGITKKIVRLGSRSTNERISKFNLENLEMVQGESRLDKTLSSQFRVLKETQREMNELMSAVRTATVTGQEVDEFIAIQYPDKHASLHTLPHWVVTLLREQQLGGWQTVGTTYTDDSLYGFWENGNDIRFLTTWEASVTSSRVVPITNRFGPLNPDDSNVQESSEDESESASLASDKHDLDVGIAPSWMQNCPNDSDVEDEEMARPEPCEDLLPVDRHPADLHNSFLAKYRLTVRPEIPTTDRTLRDLLDSGMNMWRLSGEERIRLNHYWKDEMRHFRERGQMDQFSRLRQKYENARIRYNEIKDQSKVRLLKEIDIVGCTTTGAAKLNTLLKSFSPKILIVEEAGQVLEAHVIGSLVPSVEHLILIGDPLQLRPNLANYNLSIDSKHGAALYRFDVSLMERLSSSGLRMSQLEIQRRMRPCIADLIRGSLYPKLQDHELTKQYPSVRGMAKNLFFMSHEHRETGGGEDSVSKHNTFEVEMTVDLVLHFLRQGSYSHEGDIVVLCAYLGQLVRMRDALAGKVVTVIDARDQETIAAHEEDHEDEPELPGAHSVSATKKVLLRTVDNYQGEEAAIIILSLVRNSGSIEDEQERATSVMRPSIGFLKSRNRTNVALSRAKHGLYIMGNADNLASQSLMWKTVINILDGQGSLGIGFPISCVKHPEEQHEISAPGMLPQYSPDGGCLRPCAEPLGCGHICPYKCHSDDPDHRSILCNQTCLRLCLQGHPCNKLCSETCGNCQHPIFDVTLPCGHVSPSVPCHLSKHLSQVSCRVPVIKSHSTCEHKFTIACGKDVASEKCREPCGTNLNCCGRFCTTACGDCQSLNNRTNLNSSHIPRLLHTAHPCRRSLFCGHPCGENCSEPHKCTTRCKMTCRQTCKHATCKQTCHVVCAPCAMPCSWTCPHQGTCPVPCGSVCARLPCDIRCSEVFSCGHRCPSLCGEPCSICVLCASPENKKDIVDFIMQTTMEELVPGDTLDTLIFTLSCGHSFTVETLDGVCELDKFYNRSANKWLGLALPDPGFRRIPVCPTCRSSINVPRYGRAIKRGALDLAEHNVVANMSYSLEQVKRMLDAFDQAKAQTDITQAIDKNTTTSKISHVDLEDISRLQGIYLQQNSGHPIPVQLFRLVGRAKKKKTPHHVPQTLGEVWKIATDPLLQAYSLAIGVVSQRSAHIVAYENAFATLYQEELLELTNNPAHMPPQPTENAMRVARIKVGQPPPRAEKRFGVDALWLSLRIRFLMGELAESMLKTMEQNVKWSPSYRSVWARFIRFIYRTCCQDVLLARDIAMKSECHRQIAVSGLLEFRATFELLRFDVQMWAQQQHTPEERNALLEDIRGKGQRAKELVQQVEINYLSSRPKDAKEDWMKFKEWVVGNIREPASKIIDQWRALEKSIAGGTFYSPVSLDELTQIATSFTEFTTRGHWYLCPNGHTYVIGECGGAMQEATCPECGSRIGGTNHNLEISNRRDETMDNIERRQGLDRSPWRWNRDA